MQKINMATFAELQIFMWHTRIHVEDHYIDVYCNKREDIEEMCRLVEERNNGK
ncbi:MULTISPECIES: hypothetical protein [Erysipelotrichaceae]|uniref:hypothetical protein n=1 Tax=Erysipelotrichaceae TaxID=128827 RepID=UPI0013147AC3|nr:hypothetical protein [Absiella sp. AM27-20]